MKTNAAKLIQAAIATAKHAYAPYSKFHVGAALQLDNGEIISGCNVENASYGLTICAERNAIFHAVATNQRSFRAIAIVADGEQLPYPCGACRQVISEFCGPETPVYIASISKPDDITESTVGALLPFAFKFD